MFISHGLSLKTTWLTTAILKTVGTRHLSTTALKKIIGAFSGGETRLYLTEKLIHFNGFLAEKVTSSYDFSHFTSII